MIDLLLITSSQSTVKGLSAQLNDYFPKMLNIIPYIISEPNYNINPSTIAIFSSLEIYNDYYDDPKAIPINRYIVANRVVSPDNVHKIMLLPRNEKILLVNDTKSSCLECIKHLQQVGFDFLNFVPFYPQCKKDTSNISIAITPGEIDMVPSGINSVYDIGCRVMDFTTLVKLLNKLNMLDEKIEAFSEKYNKNLMSFATSLSNIAYDAYKLFHTVREELIGRGYYAKYHFEDIIGKSEIINKVKGIAKKLAATDLSVLIEGEDGTGKELFASAIHNNSSRCKSPFVAINFSALPDTLIESELFGYEEGAFTGAKKGGKVGLFQQANGGTIFLDEIGDVSMVMQAKLLRVIQEREIMRIGGDNIIPVDVRIIAATNKNLESLISENRFRKDLYYRLKEGYIFLPTLSQRRDDIPLLIEYWLENYFHSQKIIPPQVMDSMINHPWPGNVRELMNVIKFALAVSEKSYITMEDLPFNNTMDSTIVNENSNSELSQLHRSIIDAVNHINQNHEIAGRNSIYKYFQLKGINISEYKIRKAIFFLTNSGYLITEIGSYGLRVNESNPNAPN